MTILNHLKKGNHPFKYIFLAIVLLGSSCIKKKEIDLIIHNGIIHTIDDRNSTHEAIAINDGKIIAIGKNNQILNKYKGKEILDIKGEIVYPGFIDSHCHFLEYGLQTNMIDLSSATSFEDILETLQEKNLENNEEWVIGYGWDQNQWKDKNWPNNKLLNKFFPETNVILKRVDGHAVMANQSAIKSSNIPLDTIVRGGYIEKINGEITGLFIDNAMDLILNEIPLPNEEAKKKALLEAQKDCFSLGLTTVDIAGLLKKDIELIEKLHATKELKIKIYGMLSDNDENFNYFIDSIGSPIKTGKLNVRSFKFFADGSLGSRGACLLKPYSDKTSSNGFLIQEMKTFEEKLMKLKSFGFQACTHAIGDSTNRMVLKSYAKTLKNSNDLRWRVEHAQCVSQNDLHYFRDFNIIPSVQPTHATSDFNWAIFRLGKKRLSNCYQYHSLYLANQIISLGTDFPVEKINPLNTFYAAVFRKNHKGLPIGGFQPYEALTRTQTIKGMTIWGALSNFEENEKGSLEVGKSADIVILNKDLFTVNEDDYSSIKVTKTIVDGELVYSY